MTSTDDLICKLECQDLIFRFATARDKPEKGLIEALFADDAQLVVGSAVRQGPEMIDAMANGPDFDYSIVHLFTNVVIEPTGPDTAKGSAWLLEYIGRADPEVSLPIPVPTTPRLVGDRQFEFKKTADGWRISRYEMISVLQTPGTAH